MRVDMTLINSINKQNIINIIRNHGPIFKAEISRYTGLSIPTVMKITEEFINKGIVRGIGKGESSRGKPPELLEFIPDSHYIIGIDMGTTNIVSILMDLSAKVIYQKVIPTNIKDGPFVIIRRVIDSIADVIDNKNIDKRKILGIGIGMPGILDSQNDIVVFSPDFGWENVDLVSPVKECFELPVIANNVTRAMAMGEKWFGAGREVDNFICINLGYGIGAAVVINGEIYQGSSGSSGEFGHMILEKNGPLCDCGNYGCLEALSSANTMTKKAKLYIEKGEKTAISGLISGSPDLIEAKTIFDAARLGDRLALDIINEAIEYLGIAIASMINLMDPELIILEGGVVKAGDILTGNLKRVISRRKMRYAGNNTRIITSYLGDNASAIGAASFLLNRFLEAGAEKEIL